MKEESLLLLSDLQKLINQVVLIDYTIIILGGADMCTVFEETRREGIAEGEAKGIIETGYEFGISEEEILARLQKKLNISLAEAQEYVKKFGRKNEEK